LAVRVIDDLGRPLDLTPPQRIVSLVPSVTELICDLGAADQLVGVTRVCTEPPAVVAGLPRVGGTKTADCDAITALRPDLVVMNSEENDRAHFAALGAAGLPIFVSFPTSVAGAARGIERLGLALGAEQAASQLAQRIDAALAALRELAPAPVRVFCPIWRKPWMSFNADTYCHDLLAAAGGANLCAGAAERYPVVDLAVIGAADPQVIVLPDEPYPFAERHFEALAILRDSSAWQAGRVHLCDGKDLSWYGRRTQSGLENLFRLLHPELVWPGRNGVAARA
jgi:ABC-type Fe3+-hydroxamate transport system substrate-binding protein